VPIGPRQFLPDLSDTEFAKWIAFPKEWLRFHKAVAAVIHTLRVGLVSFMAGIGVLSSASELWERRSKLLSDFAHRR
jgi:hypothetical protein